MLYRLFSSLKTSVFILAFMCLIFLIDTVLPRGEDIEEYVKAGGKYTAFLMTLNFLDTFIFLLLTFVTGILIINLAVCLYDRLKLFIRLRRKPIAFERLRALPNTITFEKTDVQSRLKKIGFKLKAEAQDAEFPGVKIYEKGLQYWWLSWFYHVGIILAIFGFFLTFLFAVEDSVVLYPSKPETICPACIETKWDKFFKRFDLKPFEKQENGEYVLTLKEFRTEYYQGLRIDYPKDKLERLALGIGIKKIEPSKEGFSYKPKMWLTRLDVKRPDGQVLDAELWVNRPFRTGGLTLYQWGYDQKIKVSVHPVRKKALSGLSNGVNGEIIDAEPRVPFQVEGIKGKFVLGSLKLGTLFKKDGTKEKITPVTTVDYIPEGSSEREGLGELRLGSTLVAKGVEFEFRDYEEGSYLSYRKDPGVWLVGLACLFVFLGLFVRSLGAWYRIQYAVDDKTVYVLISSRGILADKDRIIKKLQK